MSACPALEIHQADPETSDLIQAFLLDFGIAAIDDTLPDLSRVFFHDAGDRDRAADALRRQFSGVAVRAVDVPDEDWAARSQASLKAVQVGGIIVAPPWDVPDAGRLQPAHTCGDSTGRLKPAPTYGDPSGRLKPAPTYSGAGPTYVGAGFSRPIVIIIKPSMGFGTGHHATTRLCLAALQQFDLDDLRVIDIGTGSGVLAIAASRLGAATVVAIDDDADAIAAARDNLTLNPDARVTIEVLDLRIPDPGFRFPDHFDVVIANLTGGFLIAAAARLTSLAGPSGRLVLSGFMDGEERDVLGAFSGLDVDWRGQEDEWVCLELAPDRK